VKFENFDVRNVLLNGVRLHGMDNEPLRSKGIGLLLHLTNVSAYDTLVLMCVQSRNSLQPVSDMNL